MKDYSKNKEIRKELNIHPHKNSDAGIGFYYVEYINPDDLYGKRTFGFFFGKYLLSYDSKGGWKICNFYATGCGG